MMLYFVLGFVVCGLLWWLHSWKQEEQHRLGIQAIYEGYAAPDAGGRLGWYRFRDTNQYEFFRRQY